MKKFSSLLLLCGIAALAAAIREDDGIREEGDMVIIEASADARPPREGRQLVVSPVVGGGVPLIKPPDNQPCLTSKGKLGTCKSLKDCYPYWKIPELPGLETWVMGLYDTCSYPAVTGRQVFGVCCNNEVDPADYEDEEEEPEDYEEFEDFQIEAQVSGKCGARFFQSGTRIVGGQQATPHEFPFMAVMLNRNRQFCGGSLIDEKHILTAAHCVAHMSQYDVQNLRVRLGDHNIKTSREANHVERRVRRVIRHKKFSSSTLHYDVAILTLDTEDEGVIKFGPTIQPICLAQGNDQYEDKRVTVSGWGTLKEGGRQPDSLMKVGVKVWDNPRCKSSYGSQAPGGITSHMLCASLPSLDSCSGDSGGPLFFCSGGPCTQVGIVSWGIGCAKARYPGVYTRVTSVLPWIKKIVSKY